MAHQLGGETTRSLRPSRSTAMVVGDSRVVCGAPVRSIAPCSRHQVAAIVLS